jgi:hypothetical protein
MRRSTRPRQILALVGIQVDIQATEKKSEIARASGLSAFLEGVLVCSCRRVAVLERVTEVECMYVLWTFPSNSVTITPSRRFKSAPMERRHASHASSYGARATRASTANQDAWTRQDGATRACPSRIRRSCSARPVYRHHARRRALGPGVRVPPIRPRRACRPRPGVCNDGRAHAVVA